MDPEENFEQWMDLTSELVGQDVQFEHFIPGFIKLFDSIRDTGFLPETITVDTEQFIRDIMRQITTKLLYQEKVSAAQARISQSFLEACIQVSITGIAQQQLFLIDVATTIIVNKDWPLYTLAKKHIYGRLCQYSINLGILELLFDTLTEKCQSFKVFCPLLQLYSTLAEKSEYFDPMSYKPIMKTVSDLMNKSPPSEHKQLTKVIESARTLIKKAKGEGENFFKTLVPILQHFHELRNFDQRRFFFQLLKSLIDDNLLQEPCARYISNHPEILTTLDFHRSYADSIASILENLAKYDLLTSETIREIWKMHKNCHHSENEAFIKMFVSTALTAKDETLNEVLQCVLDTEVDEEVWFQTVLKLAKNLGERNNTTNQLETIKTKLWPLVQSGSSEFTQKARDTLSEISSIRPTQNDYLQLIRHISDTDMDLKDEEYFISLLQKVILCKHARVSHEQCQSAISLVVSKLIDTNPTSERLFEFIENTGKYIRIKLKEETVNRILELREREPRVYSFLNNTCESEMIESEALEAIARSIPNEQHDENFYYFVKHLILYNNAGDSNIEMIPLNNEDILWEMALKESPVQQRFAKLLCRIYSSNDGIKLADETTFTYFLDVWKTKPRTPQTIDILSLFISTIEDVTETGLPKRIPSTNKIKVTAANKEHDYSLTFEATRESTIGYISAYIANRRQIKHNTVWLSYNNREIKRNIMIGSLIAPTDTSIYLTITYRSPKSGRKIHKRDYFPSAMLASRYSDIVSELFESLIENDSHVYNLLKKLPTVPESEKALSELANGGFTEFSFSKPFYFAYQLTTIIQFFAENRSERVVLESNLYRIQFPDFLLRRVSEINESQIKTEGSIQREIVFEALRFFMFLKPAAPETVQHLFVVLMDLVAAATDPALRSAISKTFSAVFDLKKGSVAYPEDFDSRFGLLQDPSYDTRRLAKRAFTALKIELSVFNRFLIGLGSNVSAEFIECLEEHLTDFNNSEHSAELTRIIVGLIPCSGSLVRSLLQTASKLLQLGVFCDEMKPKFAEYLADTFLTLDTTDNDLRFFNDAVDSMLSLAAVTSGENDPTPIFKHVLSEHHEGRTPFSKFSTRYESSLRSYAGFVGLSNLSATCYMNSSLQQLFAIIPFRHAIINYKGDNEMIKELSKLFTRMHYSTSRFERTNSFCSSFKWWGGPLNTHEQQDAIEFLMLLTDSLFNDPEVGEISKHLFQGILINRISGIEDDYVHDNEDIFMSFDLEVDENIATINDAFYNYLRPDFYTDAKQYKTEDDRFINAVRRNYIKVAPPVLIGHMKRFDYDHETQRRKKINTPVIINTEIDLQKLLLDEGSEAHYILNGIIVHRGLTAQGGHYVSYIRRNDGDWTLFNDDTVSIVSEQEMFECAGGKETGVAYILFYTRKDYLAIPPLDPDPTVIAEIQEMNAENRLKRLYFSDGYFKLMNALAQQYFKLYDSILLSYTIDTLPFSQHSYKSEEFLNRMVDASRGYGLGFLNKEFICSCALKCPNEKYRNGFCSLLESAVASTEDALFIFDNFFPLVDSILSNYQHADSVFRMIHFAVSSFGAVRASKMEDLESRIIAFFMVDIPNLLSSDPDLKRSYLFNGLDLTHALLIAAMCSDVPDELKSDLFLVDISLSRASAQSVASYVHRFYNEEKFVHFVKGQSREFSPARLFLLLSAVSPNTCIDTFLSIPIGKRADDAEQERSMALAVCAANDECAGQSLLQYINVWKERFILSDNPLVRQNGIAILAHIIREANLKRYSLVAIPQDSFLEQPQFKVRTDKQQIQAISTYAAASLIACTPSLRKMLAADVKASKNPELRPQRTLEYFQFLREIIMLSNSSLANPSPLLELVGPVAAVMPMSAALTALLAVLSTFAIQLSEEVMIACVKGAKINSKLAVEGNNFLQQFIPLITSTERALPSEVINFFCSGVLTVRVKHTMRSKDLIKNMIAFLARNNAIQFEEALDSKLIKIAKANYGALLISLKSLKKKRDIFRYLNDAIAEPQMISRQELGELVLEVSSKRITRSQVDQVTEISGLELQDVIPTIIS